MRLPLRIILVFGMGLLMPGLSSAQSGTPIVGAVRAQREPGDIAYKDLEAVARRVSFLCVEPTSVDMRVGDTLDLATMYVTAYDSAGVRLGRLSAFGSQLLKNPHLVPTGIRLYVAASEGHAEFTLRYPLRAWSVRQDAPVEVRFRVEVKGK